MRGLFMIASLLSLGGAVVCWLSASFFRRQTRLFAAHPVPIAELQAGRALVLGRVQGQGLVESPVSGKACVFWEVEFDQGRANYSKPAVVSWVRYQSGTASYHHHECMRRSAELAFLEDESGRIELDLEQVETELATDHFLATGIFRNNDEKTRAILRRFALSTGLDGSPAQCRVVERSLAPGDRVVVIGEVRTERGKPVLGGSQLEPLLLTDRPPEMTARAYRRRAWATCAAALALGLLSLMLLLAAFF